ncbi:hypothetical protein ACO0OL_000332 [Hanseniaspora opuntiae]
MSSSNHHTFSKEITALLNALGEKPSQDNVQFLNTYITDYLNNISDTLFELYNYKSGTPTDQLTGTKRKAVKKKVSIDDLKFVFRDDSEKLSRLTELNELAAQREILQKQINAPENFSMLGSYGEKEPANGKVSKTGDTGRAKRNLHDMNEDDDDDDDEIENFAQKVEKIQADKKTPVKSKKQKN